jgi:predicted RNase H-like HicB family nuclease
MKKNDLNVIYTKEKNWIVARCIEIDVVSQGKTMRSAQRNIREAIHLYIDSFGAPQIPEYWSKPIIKKVSISSHGKATASIRKRSHKVSGKAGVRARAAKRKPRIPAKTSSR